MSITINPTEMYQHRSRLDAGIFRAYESSEPDIDGNSLISLIILSKFSRGLDAGLRIDREQASALVDTLIELIHGEGENLATLLDAKFDEGMEATA